MKALRRWLAKQVERWSRLIGPSHQDYLNCYLGQGDLEKMNELWRRQDRLRAIARRIAPSEREFLRDRIREALEGIFETEKWPRL